MYGYGYYPFYAFWDWTYLLVIVGAVICLIASGKCAAHLTVIPMCAADPG